MRAMRDLAGVEDRVETKEYKSLFGWDSALCGVGGVLE